MAEQSALLETRRRAHGPRLRECQTTVGRTAGRDHSSRGSASTAARTTTPAITVNLTEQQVDDAADQQDFEPEFAENATATWRQLLGMNQAAREADNSGEALDGGLAPTQRSSLLAVLEDLTASERNQLLASLGFFLSSVLMDVANIIHLTPLASQAPGSPTRASSAHGPDAAADDHAAEEELEEEEPFENDDNALMQQPGLPALHQPPRISYSSFTLLLEALGSALGELCPLGQQQVACHMLYEAPQWGPSPDADALAQLFVTMCPDAALQPDRLPVLGDMERRWFHRWLDIIRRNLPPTVADQHRGSGLRDAASSAASADPYMAADADSSAMPPPPCHDTGTQTGDEYPGYGSTTHHAEVLITLSTSDEQLSHRFPPLCVRPGECVAVSLLASMRPADDASTGSLDNCPHEYQYRRYARPRQDHPSRSMAPETTAPSAQSPPKKLKHEMCATPLEPGVKHEDVENHKHAPEDGQASAAPVLPNTPCKTEEQCVVVD